MSFGFTTTTATTCCRHLWRGGRGGVANAFFLFNYRLSSKCLVTPLRQYHRHSNDDDDDDFEMVDTLIIGGGPMGSSTAYHLAQLQQQQQQQHSNNPNHRNIVVLEQDPTYQSCSATVSAGGIRQHFSLEENVRMSMYGRDFLRNAATLLKVNNNTTTGIDDNTNTNSSSSSSKSSTTTTVDVQFQERGYLFLATTKEGKRNMLDSNAVQRRAGCTTTKLMSGEALKLQFPWLNTDDVLLGSFGTSGEGWFDPWAYLKGLKEKNQQDLGVTYLTGKPVSAKRETNNYYGDGRIVSVDILQRHHQQQGSSSSSSSSSSSPKLRRLHVNNVVNAAGAYAKRVMDLLAGDKYPLEYPIPVMPRKRCIFYFNCSTHSTSKIIPDIAPLTVDSSNVYFRSEGKPGNGNFICGVSPSCDRDVDFMCDDDDDGTDHSTTSSSRILTVTSDDYETLFEDCIWPSIAHRVPAFESIKVLSQWAGLYEYNTVDQNAIIDRHPEMKNVVMVNGFSGHGLQQSPAAGRAAAELLYYNDNEFRSLDLNVFRFDRCMEGRPVLERGIV